MGETKQNDDSFLPSLSFNIKLLFFPLKTSTFFLTGVFLAANTDTYLVTLLGQSSPVCSYDVLCFVETSHLSYPGRDLRVPSPKSSLVHCRGPTRFSTLRRTKIFWFLRWKYFENQKLIHLQDRVTVWPSWTVTFSGWERNLWLASAGDPNTASTASQELRMTPGLQQYIIYISGPHRSVTLV